MDKKRQELAREFWDRSEELGIYNEKIKIFSSTKKSAKLISGVPKIRRIFQDIKSMKYFLYNKKYANHIKKIINERLKEDFTAHDITTNAIINKNKSARAVVIARQNGTIAGIDEALLFDLNIKKLKNDGDKVEKNDKILEINDNAKKILSYERTLLNIMQRMSGIATSANNIRKIINDDCFIAGTRKTLFGLMDKKAMSIGGALTHRLNLADSILIKENHLHLLKNNIRKALETAIKSNGTKYIEIEVKNEEEALEAAETIFGLSSNKLFAIMFDNMGAPIIKSSIIKINNTLRNKNSIKKNKKIILFEASGGINEKNIMEYSKTGVDVISLGLLTHSVKAFDLSLEIL